MSRLDLFSATNIPKIQQYLDNFGDIDVTTMRDDKKNTLLHVAASKNILPLMIIYVEKMKSTFDRKYWSDTSVHKRPVHLEIQAIVNQVNNDGFTCLHYASYRDNVQMIKFLQSIGGNIIVTNSQGTNLLHSASQNNSLNSFLYLYDRININSVDYKNNTPLHLAAHYGSESVVQFLLAQQNIKINALDSQKQTPLHVATSSGKTKIVKRLLIKGAERQLKDDKQKTALDIAKNLQYNRIKNMLINDYSFKDHLKFYFNMKSKYQPQQRNFLKSALFILLFIFVGVSSHLLIIPRQNYNIYAGSCLNLLLIITFFILLSKPPTSSKMNYKALINRRKICSTCQLPQKQRSQHCDICNVCIMQYDHHCPWINGCVGKHNIRIFPIFLIFLIMAIIQNIFLSIVGIGDLHFYLETYRFFGVGAEHFDLLKIIYKVIFGINIGILLMFIGPVSYLMYIQISNLFLNLTTYQRFSSEKKKKMSMSSNGSSFSNAHKASQFGSSTNQYLLEYSNPDTCSFENVRIMLSKEETQTQIIQRKFDSADIQTDI